MVGMASLPVGEDDGFGAEFADDGGEAELVLAGWLDVGIGDSKGATPLDREELGGSGGFLGADFGRTTCSHFAGSEIENSGLIAALGHFYQRAAAGEFDIVRVGGDSQEIEMHWFSSDW